MEPASALLRLLALTIALLLSAPAAVAQDETDQDEAATTSDQAYISLSSRKYAELERTFAGYLDAYVARRIPEDELASRFAIFSRSYGLEPQFDEWVAAYPGSYSARLARGMYRISDAWRKRGNKFAKDTTDNQFREFTDVLKKAESDLQASIGLYARPVESYRHLIVVSMGLGVSGARGFLDAALRIDPEAYFPRYAYFNSITPKWGGSVSQMEAFVAECKRSPMSAANKAKIEAAYHTSLGGDAYYAKQYRLAASHYDEAYRLGSDAKWLYWSGKSSLAGGFKEQAFAKFDEVVKAHPKYELAYNNRGLLYENDIKDDEKAFKDYLSSAQLGNSWAQNRVGWWYMTGRYVPQDFDKARAYLNRSAAQGNKTAVANLRNLDKLQKSAGTAR